MTKERLYQIRMVAAGRCRNCGKLRDGEYTQHCKCCGLKKNALNLAWYYRRKKLKAAHV